MASGEPSGSLTVLDYSGHAGDSGSAAVQSAVDTAGKGKVTPGVTGTSGESSKYEPLRHAS